MPRGLNGPFAIGRESGLNTTVGNIGVGTDDVTGEIYNWIGDTKFGWQKLGAGVNTTNVAQFRGLSTPGTANSTSTADATPKIIASFAVPLSACTAVWVRAVGKKVGANADGIVSNLFNAATNNAGTTALVGTTGGSSVENSAGAPTVTIVANDSTDTIDVLVTGIAAETWVWHVFTEVSVASVASV